jgi:predicted RNA-binding Zn ribbon-like protein
MGKYMTEAEVTEIGSIREYGGLAFVGGHSGLDFVNSVKYRGSSNNGDRLVEFLDIVKWAHIAELLDAAECRLLMQANKSAKKIGKLHSEICVFREAVRVVLAPNSQSKPTFSNAAQIVERAISKLRPDVRIDRETRALVQSFPVQKPRDLMARIVDCVRDLLSQRSGLKIKTCDGHDCDWMFVDRTKAKRRKWCDTRTCGNNARVRRHREAKTSMRHVDG